jgi:hypothetical protein
MSHDLDVVMRRQPPPDAFRRFAEGREGLEWSGSLGSEDNLAVSRAARRAGASFLVYDGTPDDVAVGLYGDLVPGLSYTALVAVPFGGAEADHDLAFSFAAWLADEYEGIVYSDQLDEVVWPESRRGEKAAELADDPDVV